MRDDLSQAKVDLAALINIAPGTSYQLVPLNDLTLLSGSLDFTVHDMETMALASRPELREETYQARIDATETRKSMMQMLPDLELNVSAHHDSNSFQLNKNWSDAGMRITWNLLQMISVSKRLQHAGTQEKISQTRRIALHMAVLTQVHIAYEWYNTLQKQLRRAESLNAVDQRILANTKNLLQNDSQSKLVYILNNTNAVISQMKRDEVFANFQNARSRLFVTMGIDLLPHDAANADLDTLAQIIKERLESWVKDPAIFASQIAQSHVVPEMTMDKNPPDTEEYVHVESQQQVTPADNDIPKQPLPAQHIEANPPAAIYDHNASLSVNRTATVANVVAADPTENTARTGVVADAKEQPLASWQTIHQRLLAIPATHYTIQLVGVSQESTMREFIARHQLQRVGTVYVMLLRGGHWYSLIYGDYPNQKSAAAAVATLSEVLQKDTWVRSMQNIHTDIRNFRASDTSGSASGHMRTPANTDFAGFEVDSNGTHNRYLQLGVFWNKNNAQALSTRFDDAFPGRIHTVEDYNQSIMSYRVQIGPFASESALRAIQNELKHKGATETFMVVR